MANDRIQQSLNAKFEESRIVLWYDENEEFLEEAASFVPSGVRFVSLKETGPLALKNLIEIEHASDRFLVYHPGARRPPEEDWLLDLFFYSNQFTADTAEMIRDDLGLLESRIREFIKGKLIFFSSNKRKEALRKLVVKTDSAAELAMKMLQVLLAAQSSSVSHLLLGLFECCRKEETYEPQVLKDIEKYGLAEELWDGVRDTFGVELYGKDEAFSGRALCIILAQLAFSEVDVVLHGEVPGALRHLVIKSQSRASSAAVFFSEWRDKASSRLSYLWHCQQLEELFELGNVLTEVHARDLAAVSTFESAVKICLAQAKELSRDNTVVTRGEAREILATLKGNFWIGKDETSYAAILRSLDAALSFLDLRADSSAGIHAATPLNLATAYRDTLWQFDYYYRQYYAGQQANGATNFLAQLSEDINSIYSDWYLTSLARVWNGFLEQGFLAQWALDYSPAAEERMTEELVAEERELEAEEEVADSDAQAAERSFSAISAIKSHDIPNQYNFFPLVVKKYTNKRTKPRVVVIISDGLRLEVGQELKNRLNGRDNNEATLTMMLGVLPSYTSLGMAALLPHEELSISAKGQVLVDGKDASSFETRAQAVASQGGVALKYTDLKGLSREAARALIGDKQLVYIYHDVIDATGDQAKTEHDTFVAADAAIAELETLAQMVLVSLNTSHVIITADHGFLYDERGQFPTAELKHLTGNIIKEHKRYVLGENLDTVSKVLKGDTSKTAGTRDSHEIILPYGCERFNQYGAGAYMHGGAMPQEVFIPVVCCQKLRDKAAEKAKTKKTSVVPLIGISKISSLKHSFKFAQTELISDKVKPITLRIGFFDGAGEPISNQHTVTFDAANDSQREKLLAFSFKSQKYNRTADYQLVMKDEETQRQIHAQAFKVTILLTDDFEGF